MTELSIEELEAEFTRVSEGYGSIGWEEWHGEYPDRPLLIPNVGYVEHVKSEGGEGQGSGYWVVLKLTQLDGTERLFRKDGTYASYMYGDYFEYSAPMREVKARPVTVIEYS